MNEKKIISSKRLFVKITTILFLISVALIYYSSIYMRNIAVNNLAEDDAKKTSELAFEVIYTKMQGGATRDDLEIVMQRLNHLRPGLSMDVYRSTLVEELYGKVAEQKKIEDDPYIQKAFNGEKVFLPLQNNKVRYITPIVVKQECLLCHHNAKIGDVNGVLDTTFLKNDIKIPLNTIIVYFIVFSIIAIVLIFFMFQYFMSKAFINPITTFSKLLKDVKESKNYSQGLSFSPKTYELYSLKNIFNELLLQINFTLEELKYKNKLLSEYKRAVEKATIVSKTDPKGVITYVNDTFCNISGYSKEELLGKNHNIVRSPHMPKEAFKDLWQTIKNKKVWHGVVENRAKNGESYFVQATVIPILDENNEIVEFVSARQDITELKKLQQKKLASSVNKALKINFEDMLNMIPVSAVIVDIDSEVLASNDIFNDKFLYYSKQSFILDAMFLDKEGYLSNKSIIDWKNELALEHHMCSNKILVNILNHEEEFYVSVKELDGNKYLVLIFDIECPI